MRRLEEMSWYLVRPGVSGLKPSAGVCKVGLQERTLQYITAAVSSSPFTKAVKRGLVTRDVQEAVSFPTDLIWSSFVQTKYGKEERERKEFDNKCMIVMTLKKKVFCVNESDEKI